MSGMDALKNKRQSILDQFVRLSEFVGNDELLQNATCEGINVRFKTLERLHSMFDSVQGKIEEKKYDAAQAAVRKGFEDSYYVVYPRLLTIINQRAINLPNNPQPPPAPVINNGPGVRLPELNISTFSGDRTKWTTFNNAFTSMVHNRQNLCNVDKFQYLVSLLSGSAAKVIEAIEINDNNYPEALGLLRERYDNRKLIVQEHVKQLFDFRVVKSVSDIRDLIDSTNAHVRALRTLDRPTEHWDDLLVYLISTKLDSDTSSKWQESASVDTPPTLEEMLAFLKRRCQVLETSSKEVVNAANTSFKLQKQKPTALVTSNATNITSDGRMCVFCNRSGHLVYRCFLFKKLSISKRIDEMRKRKICLNCLRTGHFCENCPSNSCKICSAKHHMLLHLPVNSSSSTSLPLSSNTICNTNQRSSNASDNTNATSLQSSGENVRLPDEYVFLATANVDVFDNQMNPVSCRVLLDSGSQLNFATERVVNQLSLPRTKTDVYVTGVGGTETRVKHKTMLHMKSKINDFQIKIEACVLPQITGMQPSRLIDISDWVIPANIKLADPQFNMPKSVDILLGADVYYNLLSIGQIHVSDRYPTLQNTVFGYVVSGKKSSSSIIQRESYQCNLLIDAGISLDKQVEQFWQLEQVSDAAKTMSLEDEQCEGHFVENTVRNSDGRYVVSLPFKDDPSLLGNSEWMAKQRFYTLERKLQRNHELKVQYSKFLSEYLMLNHMEEINELQLPKLNYFLPHHCVIKPESSSTKLRVVFDGSAKTTSGKSLNELLMIGSTVQSDLFSIILRFRLWCYVFTTDIAKMYRQIIVSDSDQKYQCIFWRESPGEKLRIFQLKTVTYGTSAAPYLATRVLKQLSLDYADEYPGACKAINDNCYVDDLMTGCNSLNGVRDLQKQLVLLFKAGGFELKKWCANHPSILENIPSSDLETHTTIRDNDVIKTLGLIWEPKADQFLITIQPLKSSKVTKRTVLADTMKIFDPLGLIAPIVVSAKIFLQQMWKLQLSWDESLPQSLHSSWLHFRDQLQRLDVLKFDRNSLIENPVNVQLHAFADGSEKAYGCCIYIRSINSLGMVKVSLFCAKSRVAPTKTVTLPRIELCAAQLCAQLVDRVLKILNHDLKIDRVFYWSDSTTVLSWLKAPAYEWKTFVSNRVANIQEISNFENWYHVRTHINPADLVSRGTSPGKLCASKLWFNGPEFLMNHNIVPEIVSTLPPDEIPDRKIIKCSLATLNLDSDFIAKLTCSNSYLKIVRVIAYCMRFILRTRNKIKQSANLMVTVEEFNSAIIVCVKCVQSVYYANEIKSLLKTGFVKNRSSVSSLTPFLDENQVIRVGGRLKNSTLTFTAKHPILLPSNHPFTVAVINYFHCKNFHAGPQALLATVRQIFWPVHGKELCRKVVGKCVRCFKAKPRTISQLMGDLPSDRLIPGRPFLTVGIDFMGPFETHYKLRGKRPTKSYVSVFICFTTKAVHMEVVSDLTTEAFLLALKRFVGRRGRPKVIYSDNATNFIGTKNCLFEFMQSFLSATYQHTVATVCAEDGIEWCTIPPRSPHFGGLWEAAVKSAKIHFKKQFGFASLTYEELATVVVQIEAILNSRPLTPMSTNPNDLQALTPGHFLIGCPLNAIVEPDVSDQNINRLKRWRHVTWLQQNFWRRWQKEYLHTLQSRGKWREVRNNINLHDLVLLQEDNVPPLKWPLGRVVRLHTGGDGKIRVVTVKTNSGLFKRSIVRLAPLPLPDEH